MRKVEQDRLNTLRAKVNAGIELNEKEKERLAKLEEIERMESEKNESKNSNESSTLRGSAIDTDNSGGNNRSGESISGESASTERADGNGSNTNPTGDSGQGNSTAKSDNSGGGSGGTGSRNTPRQSRDFNSSGSSGGSSGGNGDTSNSTGSIETEEILSTQKLVVKPKAVTPRKPKATTKKVSGGIDNTELIKTLIQGAFGMVSTITAKKHWEVSEEESESVAVPLTKIIEDLSPKQKKMMEKYTNPILLFSAVAGIVVPRVMVDISQSNRRKVLVNGSRGEANISPSQSEIKRTSTELVNETIGKQDTQSERFTSTTPTNLPNADSEIAKLIGKGNFGM